MEITLEKIELVKDRTGVTYKEAKEALEAADGSVVDAIINIEETIDAKINTKFSGQSSQVIEKLKQLIKKGNVSKIVVKKDDEVILNLPVNIGILGTVIAPIPIIIGTVAAFGTKCIIEVVKEDGTIIDVSEMANENIEAAIEKGSIIADEVKVKSADVYQNIKAKTSEALEKVKKDDDDTAFFSEDGFEGCMDECACDDECTCDDDCQCQKGQSGCSCSDNDSIK